MVREGTKRPGEDRRRGEKREGEVGRGDVDYREWVRHKVASF